MSLRKKHEEEMAALETKYFNFDSQLDNKIALFNSNDAEE